MSYNEHLLKLQDSFLLSEKYIQKLNKVKSNILSGKIVPDVDPSRIKVENIEDLNQVELFMLKK